jgi:hypothetical protein
MKEVFHYIRRKFWIVIVIAIVAFLVYFFFSQVTAFLTNTLTVIQSFVIAKWYVFILMIIPGAAFGVFYNSVKIRRIVKQIRQIHAENMMAINFGELVVVDVMDKTRDNMWIHGLILLASIAVIILLFIF